MNLEKEYQYRKEIKLLRKELSDLKLNYDSAVTNLNDMLHSKSWKVTEPLRRISAFTKQKHEESVLEPSPLFSYDYHTIPSYVSHYEEDMDFGGMNPLVKAIAFYLPQFHTIPLNDKCWGKGFTEWTNTKKSKPLFDGHYQPREPHDDFGYYCLEDVEVLKKQIELAKKHQLYGFAFYYYWFSGKRLLEKPVDMLLDHKEIDFPFLLCWANENWTKTWDGLDQEVLMEQKYLEQDPYNFIVDIKKYLMDERYIRVDGKPVIMVYNPVEIPDYENVCKKWREASFALGIGEILIWSRTEVAQYDDSNTSFVDGEFDFAPHGFTLPGDEVCGISNASNVVNYSKLVSNLWSTYENHFPLRPFSYSVMMGWDNSARRQNGFKIFIQYSLEAFYLWTTMVIKKMRQNGFSDTFLFVNAWNEWGEGTYLEPDKAYGYANINTLSKAICGIPFSAEVKLLDKKVKKISDSYKFAVQCHVFHVDLFEEMLLELKKIPGSYDLFLTTDTEEKKKKIKQLLKKYEMNFQKIDVMENRGRDLLPMLQQMKNVICHYDYFLHLHTKKSVSLKNGAEWRNYLFHHLLGSKENIMEILDLFHKDSTLGLVYPVPHEASFLQLVNPSGAIGGNLKYLESLFTTLEIPLEEINYHMTFPYGSMFMARVDAILDLFVKFDASLFALENGQLDGTYAHAIERSFELLCQKNGYQCFEILNLHK